VLGLSELPEQQMLISVVMGAVLFTILVQGLSINKVIALLKMDKPPLSDRVAKLEAELSAEKITLDRLPELQEGGLFSLKIAEEIRERCEEALLESRKKLKNLREEELNITEEKRLLFLSCFAAEKHLYYQMFIKGHLSEKAFRVLNHDMDLEIDLMRYRSQPVKSLTANRIKAVLTRYISALDIIYFLRPLINQLKIRQTIAVYEEKWGLHQGSLAILNHLDEIASMESIEPSVVQEVRHQFQEWMQLTKTYLDNIAEQFPEFVRDIQKKLAERVLLHSKFETIEKQANDGLLPEGVADEILHQYVQEIRALKKISPSQLKLDPHELLRKIPFLSHIPSEEVEDIIHLLKERRFSPREIIIQEGAVEDDLYLILRGVVRVSKEISGKDIELATLMAGDFFGEIALLFGVKRTASCKAVTPCILYSLNRHDFDKVREKFPQIDRALRQEAEKRRNQQ